jgi:type I restriction enzyme S subunit
VSSTSHSELPDSWTSTRLENVVERCRGREDPQDYPNLPYLGLKHIEEETMELLGKSRSEEYESTSVHFFSGDILYGRLRPYLNKVHLADFEGLGSGEIIVLTPTEDIYSQYLTYLLNSQEFVRYADHLSTGDRPRVNYDKIKEFELSLPPLAEQQRIVDKIEELFSKLDSGVSELEEATERLEKYRKAILEKAIWGELTEKWRQEHGELTNPRELLTDPSEYNPPDESDIPEVPDKWILATFGDVFEVYLGSTPKRSNDEYWNGDINWISSGEVEFSIIKDSNEKITRAGLESCSTIVHPPNTVMLGIIGQGETRGRAAMLDIEAAHNQNTVAIRPEEAGIPAQFIYYFFMESYERTRRLGSGNQQKALSKTRVQNMVFPLPPVEEQKRIADVLEQSLSTIEKVEQSVETNIKRSDRLRQSILKHAFEGKLVPQEPTEEPPAPDGGETNLEQGEQTTFSEVTSNVE